MRWPWVRRVEAEERTAALVSAAAADAAAARERELVAELARKLINPTPVAPWGNQPAQPPGAFATSRPIYFASPHDPAKQPGAAVSVEMLRRLVAHYDILQSIIWQLIREVYATPLRVQPRDPKAKGLEKVVAEAEAFFTRSGGLGGFGSTRRNFEASVLDDLLVVGAGAVYLERGLGGAVLRALPIDAASIRPVVDAYGWPDSGKPYEQYVEGMVRAQFGWDELIYDGLWSKTDSPYFTSGVERLVNVVNSALRADEWNRSWLTDGNVPDQLISCPEDWGPEQIKEYAVYFDSILAGDTKKRVKAKLVPGGMKGAANHSRKDQDFADFEMWLTGRACAIFGVQKASLGFVGEQYKVTQEASMDATSAIGVASLLDWRKDLYDEILSQRGYPELQVENVTKREEKASERATRNQTRISSGQMTINEARAEDGLDPIEGGDVLLVPSTLRPLEQAIAPPEPPVVPNKDTPPLPSPDSGEGERAALAAWERKAVGRVKDGRSVPGFESDAIRGHVRRFVEGRLEDCDTVAEVKAVFARAVELDEAEMVERTAWAERVEIELAAMGKLAALRSFGKLRTSG